MAVWLREHWKTSMLTAGMARTERFRSNRPDRRPRVVAVLDIVDEVCMECD